MSTEEQPQNTESVEDRIKRLEQELQELKAQQDKASAAKKRGAGELH